MAKITPIDIIKGVSVVETSPFVLRSSSVSSPLVLRSFSVHPPFILRSISVRESKNDRRMNEE